MNVRLVFTNKYVNLNTLDYLCTHFKIPHGTYHRAEDDAGMCTRLFLKKYTIVCIIMHLVRFTKLSAHYDMHNSTFQLEYVIKECPTYFLCLRFRPLFQIGPCLRHKAGTPNLLEYRQTMYLLPRRYQGHQLQDHKHSHTLYIRISP